MTIRWRSCWCLLALVLAAPAWAEDCGSLDALRWLLGDWTAAGSKSVFHESWAAAGPQTFEGAGVERAVADGAVKGAESLRLVEMAGGVFYVAKVTHNELPVAFRLTSCSDSRYVFENPAHDFPRRLEYRRGDDGRLTVAVSDGADRGFALDFTRATPPTDARAAVLAAEDARFAAMVAADAAAMRRSFAPTLQYVHSSGQVEDREQLIESITGGRLRYIAVEPAAREVVMLGEAAALVRGHGRFRVMAGESPLELQIRYLAVYGIRDGIWQLQSWQSLRTP
jgi:hypothetical protein